MGTLAETDGSESRLMSYVEGLASVLGHADRVMPFRFYCTGLLLPGDRKSVEPMAAQVAPGRVQAAHQSLHHFVAKADWSNEAVLAAVRARVLPVMAQRSPIRGWMIDDTGMPKKGTHSVGVARQYCGQLGKQDNCQVAVTLSLAGDHASLSIAHRLYLPQAWADDPARRTRAGVPDEVAFQTKPQVALDQIRAALQAGVPPAPVLADAGYGIDTAFRDGITELGLLYAVGIQSSTSLWPPGTGPLPPKPYGGRGRPPSLVGRDANHTPVSARQLAIDLPRRAWRRVTWREGTNVTLTSRFAAVRVRPAHRDYKRSKPRSEEWCLIEWPAGEAEPTKYWLSTLPATISRRTMVNLAKLRWRIERDDQDLKQELGLGHYEGRGWRGFHHHATLCIAAYGFLVAEGVGAWIPGMVGACQGRYVLLMPFKHNAARRHHIRRARYRVTNWAAYEAGLRRRGDLMCWVDEAALAGWHALRRSTPGGQPRYSDLAIELVLTLRLVFHLALRQAEGFARSVLALLGLGLAVPDHTTLSRRGAVFAGRQPRVRTGTGPVHLVLDSTGLELFGQGEWCAAKHGRLRRRWLKLHVGVDASTGEIAAHVLTEEDGDDAAQAPDLLRQCEGTLASLTADGAYDRGPVYQAAAARSPGSPPAVVIPPRSDAVLSTADPDRQTPRDRHIQVMADQGRIGWQRATEYGKRNHAETAMSRYKHLIGPKLRARSRPGQRGEVALAVQVLNRMIREAKPISVRR